jgi:hypothetical protein
VALENGANIQVSHVLGKRMIAQGNDGISRGELNKGVTAGFSMLAFVPLNLTAFERPNGLQEWVESWLGSDTDFLSPSGWVERGHSHDGGLYDSKGFLRVKIKSGKLVWVPSPAAADVALEELKKALIKRQDCTHKTICP